MPPPFLDTNIILRHLLNDVPGQSPRATAYLERVERGDLRVRLADTVVFEAVFVLERRRDRAKADIRSALLRLIDLPGMVLPNKARIRRALDIYVQANIAFGDSYHAALMEDLGLTEVVSFDKEFDRLATVRRVEP